MQKRGIVTRKSCLSTVQRTAWLHLSRSAVSASYLWTIKNWKSALGLLNVYTCVKCFVITRNALIAGLSGKSLNTFDFTSTNTPTILTFRSQNGVSSTCMSLQNDNTRTIRSVSMYIVHSPFREVDSCSADKISPSFMDT